MFKINMKLNQLAWWHFLQMGFSAFVLFFLSVGLSKPVSALIMYMNDTGKSKTIAEWATFVIGAIIATTVWCSLWLWFNESGKQFIRLLKSSSIEEPPTMIPSEFSTKHKQPNASEYLDASYDELLDRLNRNPGSLDSEFPFIESVIAIRNAKSLEETNRGLVQQTKNLVFATWGLCMITILTFLYTLLS